MKKKVVFRRLAVFALLAVSFFALTRNLGADLPTIAPDEVGIHFDPPSKSHNARNYVLYGKWLTDEWTPYIHSPFYTLSQFVIFMLFGTGYMQMRILSVCLTLASLYLIYALVSKAASPTWGLITLLTASVSYIVLIFGRSGLLEPYVAFFVLAAAWSLEKSYKNAEISSKEKNRKSANWIYLAAIFSSFAFLSKPVAIYVVVSFILLVVIRPPFAGWKLRISAAAIALAPIIIDYAFIKTISSNSFQRETNYWFHREVGYDFKQRWIHQPFVFNFFRWEYAILAAGILGFYFLYLLFIRGGLKSNNVPVVFVALNLALGSQVLAFFDYRPIRYYYPLVLYSFVIGGIVASRIYRWIRQPHDNILKGIVKPAFWIITAIYFIKFCVIDIISSKINATGTFAHYKRISISIAASLLLFVIIKILHNKIITLLTKMPPAVRKLLIILFGLIVLGMYLDRNQKCVLNYLDNPRYSMRNYSKYLGSEFSNVVAAGPNPLFAVMENEHRALKVTKYNLNWGFMKEKIPTHIITMRRLPQRREYKKMFPEIMASAKLLDIINLCNDEFLFFGVDPAPLVFSQIHFPEKNRIIVNVTNPDKHSPQNAGLVLISIQNEEVISAEVKRLILPVAKNSQAVFSLPDNTPDSVKIYAVEPQLWMYPRSIASEGDELLWDEKSWGLECRKFKTSKYRPEKEFGAVEWRGKIEGENILISAGLKGVLMEGGRIEVSWSISGSKKSILIISPEMITKGEYTDFAMTVKNEKDMECIMRISFIGGGDIRLSSIGLFSIDHEFLQTNSSWHETIIINERE